MTCLVARRVSQVFALSKSRFDSWKHSDGDTEGDLGDRFSKMEKKKSHRRVAPAAGGEDGEETEGTEDTTEAPPEPIITPRPPWAEDLANNLDDIPGGEVTPAKDGTFIYKVRGIRFMMRLHRCQTGALY